MDLHTFGLTGNCQNYYADILKIALVSFYFIFILYIMICLVSVQLALRFLLVT